MPVERLDSIADMDAETALTQIRWTRAEPPALAASDPDRRALYSASLQQFEELLAAARAAGHASRPLPLFYALSQAGRAIVAAHGESAETWGHGLGEVVEDPSLPLLARRIRRRAGKGDRDTFGAVARATGSGDFDGNVELGAVWVANPHTPRLPLEHWGEEWRLALLVVDEDMPQPAGVDLHEKARILRVLPFADPIEATAGHGPDLAGGRYPTLSEPVGATFTPKNFNDITSWEGYVVWRTDQASIDEIAPRPTWDDERYLIPLLPAQEKLLSPLMLWWALLYGFSVYARYQPQVWTRALDVDRSPVAVAVEHLLRQALEWVPRLVYDALLGKFYPVPESRRLS